MYKICRTCLEKTDVTFKINENISDCEGVKISFGLRFCVPELYLGLSHNPEICRRCRDSLNASYAFKKRCLATDNVIGNFLKNVRATAKSVMLDDVLAYCEKQAKEQAKEQAQKERPRAPPPVGITWGANREKSVEFEVRESAPNPSNSQKPKSSELKFCEQSGMFLNSEGQAVDTSGSNVQSFAKVVPESERSLDGSFCQITSVYSLSTPDKDPLEITAKDSKNICQISSVFSLSDSSCTGKGKVRLVVENKDPLSLDDEVREGAKEDGARAVQSAEDHTVDVKEEPLDFEERGTTATDEETLDASETGSYDSLRCDSRLQGIIDNLPQVNVSNQYVDIPDFVQINNFGLRDLEELRQQQQKDKSLASLLKIPAKGRFKRSIKLGGKNLKIYFNKDRHIHNNMDKEKIIREKLISDESLPEPMKSLQEITKIVEPQDNIEQRKRDDAVECLQENEKEDTNIKVQQTEVPKKGMIEQENIEKVILKNELIVQDEQDVTDVNESQTEEPENINKKRRIEQEPIEEVILKNELIVKDGQDDENPKVPKKKNLTYCLFCKIRVFDFSRHLSRTHWNEIEVQRIFSKPVKSPERKMLLSAIRKKGNFLDKLVNKPHKFHGNIESLPCRFCFGFYSRNQLWRHLKTCTERKGLKIAAGEHENKFIKEPEMDKQLKLKVEVFPSMSVDNISFEAKKDWLICEMGAKTLHQLPAHVISRRMRELATLLIEMKKQDPSITNLLDALQPKHFFLVTEAIIAEGKYSSENDKFDAPMFVSNTIKWLKQCCQIVLEKEELPSTTDVADTKSGIQEIIRLLDNWQDLIFRKRAHIKSPKIAEIPFEGVRGTQLQQPCPRKRHVKWLQKEKEIVLDFFKDHIKNKTPPKRRECESLFEQFPELRSKSWLKIKVFVQNVYTKKLKS